jgi:hypothetical protein
MSRPKHLTAQQLAERYHTAESVRVYVDRHAENLTLVGPFTHRKPPRRATRARFAYWKQRILGRLYDRCPLLAGYPYTGDSTNGR